MNKKIKDWFELSAAYDFQEGNEVILYIINISLFVKNWSMEMFLLYFIFSILIIIYRDYGFRKWKFLMKKAGKYHLVKEGLFITDFALVREKQKMKYTANSYLIK